MGEPIRLDEVRRLKDPNANAVQRFWHRAGQKYLETEVALGLIDIDEKRAKKPGEVRNKGFISVVAIGAVAAIASFAAYNKLTSDEPERVIYKPDSPCEFSNDTTVVYRDVNEGTGSLAVSNISGVSWGTCSSEAVDWIEAHNPPLKGWENEAVTIPVSVRVED